MLALRVGELDKDELTHSLCPVEGVLPGVPLWLALAQGEGEASAELLPLALASAEGEGAPEPVLHSVALAVAVEDAVTQLLPLVLREDEALPLLLLLSATEVEAATEALGAWVLLVDPVIGTDGLARPEELTDAHIELLRDGESEAVGVVHTLSDEVAVAKGDTVALAVTHRVDVEVDDSVCVSEGEFDVEGEAVEEREGLWLGVGHAEDRGVRETAKESVAVTH